MFRNPVSEFRLASGKASGRSFRPQCEALEERIVLDSTPMDTLAPSMHVADPRALLALEVFTATLDRFTAKLEHNSALAHEALGEGGIVAAFQVVRASNRLDRNYEKVAHNVFQKVVEGLDTPANNQDPAFQAALMSFNAALQNLDGQSFDLHHIGA